MLRKWGMLVVMLLLTPVLAFAQNTGKISGRVIDQATGESIPGANVAVVGTTYGSITDVDGNYFILGVPVGSYDVQASFVGYQSETITGVQVSSGYTRELNFQLSEGDIELGEIVIEYERPLIQKDAVGTPKIVDAEQIVNLPVRGAASVAAIQAGVVSQEGSGTLNIRGGRGSEVSYYIDGVKVIGTTALPQSAIQEQEIMIGNISARYGDAMSGIINITTKSGSTNFFGSLEGITSEALDAYGYNLVSGTVGGPVAGDKLNFFLSAEFTDQLDSGPRAIGELHLPESIRNDLLAAPQAFRIDNADGETVYLPIPNSLADGAMLLVDDDAHVIVDNNQISFSDGTTIAIPEGADIESLNLNPIQRAQLLDPADFEREKAGFGAEYQNLSVAGNLQFSLFDQGRLRLGGRYITGNWDGLAFSNILFNPFNVSETNRDEYQIFGTWTQHLSGSTFYQLQADYTDYFSESFDPRFGPEPTDWLRYGDVDGEEAWATLRGYKDAPTTTVEQRINGTDTVMVNVPTFGNSYGDSDTPPGNVLLNLTNLPGGTTIGYSKSSRTQFRLTGSATTQVGINQLEFGGEYETRTYRAWNITASRLAGLVNDGFAEDVDPNDPLQNPNGWSNYEDIPAYLINNITGGYGYSLYGDSEVDTEDMAQFVLEDNTKPVEAYNEAPYQPIYYGGYVQNKIEFRDIVLNLGLRVDVFDNNMRVLKDKYARRPIRRAEEISGRPGNIGADYAVYFDDAENVIGYRDLDGTFYTTGGEEVQAAEILLNGAPILTSSRINETMFEDYEPQVTFMPRIGVSFPVTDRALFFASYGVVTQRPSTNSFQDLGGFVGTGSISNTNLNPERTTKYELGFRQRLGERSALTISGFFQQIDDLIQRRDLNFAFPNAYLHWENVDFGTVKGMEFGFDMRRTNGLAANVNYTLSFADGTGSGSNTTSTITWVDETPPNFISPLDFDQRHKVNVSLDYRLGKGEGPAIGGANILENFGVNVLFTAGSGFPYTAISDIGPLTVSRAPLPSGGVNANRMPASNRVDLKFDRRFQIRSANITAFLWVENLFDNDNVQNVWRATGLAGDDGYLSTREGELAAAANPAVWPTLYQNRTNLPGNYGIPRQTRLGLRLDF